MASYISARFEKTLLPAAGLVRVVVRNKDDGIVPPLPSATYYPTNPDTLAPFIVAEFVSNALGERYKRVASMADYTGLPQYGLTVLEDLTANFVGAGVVPGDLLQVTLSSDELWSGEEYPGTSPFIFPVDSVVSPTRLIVSVPFPSYQGVLTWAIPTRSIASAFGRTLRSGTPAPGTEFRDVRFATFHDSVVTAENFVAAMKADMAATATASTGAGLISENYTAVPSV